MEQTDAVENQHNTISIAGINDMIVAHRTAGFYDVRNAALASPFNIIPKWEERI